MTLICPSINERSEKDSDKFYIIDHSLGIFQRQFYLLVLQMSFQFCTTGLPHGSHPTFDQYAPKEQTRSNLLEFDAMILLLVDHLVFLKIILGYDFKIAEAGITRKVNIPQIVR